MKRLQSFYHARLSKKIVASVFLSIIAIEFVILIPSFLRREQEILDNLTNLSCAQITAVLASEGSMGDSNKGKIINGLSRLTRGEKPLFIGGTIYGKDGGIFGAFGQPPILSFEDFQTHKKSSYLDRGTYQYDFVQSISLDGKDYTIIISHDAIAIRDEFFAFNGRILFLVIIISIAVTTSTAVILNRWVIDPILRLRMDLTTVGNAFRNNKKLPQTLESVQQIRDDELGDVMLAFDEMTKKIASTLEDIEASQQHLLDTEELIHDAKMSGLEQIVAGIAHEVNNPLGFVCGNVHYLQDYISILLTAVDCYRRQEKPSITEEELEFIINDLPKLCDSMKSGADRVRDIVISLRNFARLDEAGRKIVDLHDSLNGTLSRIAYRLEPSSTRTSRIEVKKDYGKLPLVECDPGQVNQVFLNILMNAIDALEDPSCSSDHLELCLRTEVVDQNFVSITFQDNGVGIPEHIQSEVFNPFFTTKPVGRGKGLGLALVDRIVNEEHQGQVDLSSDSQGTCVTITLPVKLEAYGQSQQDLELSQSTASDAVLV
ncbi:MAG: HAMP domain-containing sensor histidine kinase [Cyanobacteria bacterium P01_D01_bin.73]